MRNPISPEVFRGDERRPKGALRRARFIAGIILMSASFLVYPAYSMVPFLPLSDKMKIGVTLLTSLLSWGIFYAGIYLSGQEGYEWLKRRWKR